VALLGCLTFVGGTVLAHLPQFWKVPEGPTPAHELVAHYQNSRSLIIWMNAAIVWLFVGLNCLPGSSFPAAPRGLRITLATVAIATVGTSIAKGVEILIGRHQPQRFVESQWWRFRRSLFQSIGLHSLFVVLVLSRSCGGGGAAALEPDNLTPIADGAVEISLLDPSSSSEPTLDFKNPSTDYADPLLILERKDERADFGEPQPFIPSLAQSINTPKGMLRGLLCFIPKDTKSLDEVESCHPVGTLYARTLYVPRTNFREGFPGISGRYEWFAIDYRGTFTVRTADSYRFRLYSDDGARLVIDGKLLTNNDGIHQASNAFATIALAASEHSIRVHYFQGPQMEVALILSVIPPGGVERVWSAEL